MNKIIPCVLFGLGFIFILALAGCTMKHNDNATLRVLILSGSNNHDWKATSPFLQNMIGNSELFVADITNRPDTLEMADLGQYAVIVSNWNSWPENDFRWSQITEKAFLDFIKKGGGLVTFHSSTSAFYRWPEFQEITTGSWVMDSTWHGKPGPVCVVPDNIDHPVTRGMEDFIIYDELWINTRRNGEYAILGSATNKDITAAKGISPQPAIMVYEYGKGRIFHTILGHDVQAMRNPGFQTLMLRGTEWAARGKVSQNLPPEPEKP